MSSAFDPMRFFKDWRSQMREEEQDSLPVIKLSEPQALPTGDALGDPSRDLFKLWLTIVLIVGMVVVTSVGVAVYLIGPLPADFLEAPK